MYIPINRYYDGLIAMLPIALHNKNNDVLLYGGYNGYKNIIFLFILFAYWILNCLNI